MDAFAAELGSTRDEVIAAGKAAANAALDAAVAAGDVTEERAAAIRERIDAYDGEGCAFGGAFKLGFGHGVARGFLGGDVFEAAADALGIESSALIEQLGEATSLEALAGEQGVAYDDVKASILAAVQADLDAAVAEGMDQERADEVIARLTTWLDEGGQLDGLRGRFGRRSRPLARPRARMRPMRRSQGPNPLRIAQAPDARASSGASLVTRGLDRVT